MVFQKIKVERISHKIVEQIRREIIVGKFKPGEYLPTELELSNKFNVSRSSVREALQLLEGYGVIERRKREGTIIRKVTIEDLAMVYTPKPEHETLLELLETRKSIEKSVVKYAIDRASTDEIEELERTLDWMFEDPKRYAEDDKVFHIMLARLSHNQVMVNIIETLQKTMNKIGHVKSSDDRVLEIVEEHRNIVEAIKKRDCDLAQRYMIEHLVNYESYLVKDHEL